MDRFVAYYRCSTKRQFESQLGLLAQKEAVRRVIGSGRIVAEFEEAESGRRCDRPQLAAALSRARATRSKLVIGRLDRLARNCRFIAEILESGVEIICADMPTVDRMTLQILGSVAEKEVELIRARIKAGLAQSTKPLGGWRVERATGALQDLPGMAKAASVKGAAARSKAAAAARSGIMEGVAGARAEMGANASVAQITDWLQAHDFRSPRGGEISRTTVYRALAA